MSPENPPLRAFPVPANEEERLTELYRQELLDGSKVAQIDRICALARDLFKVPVALVTLLDRDDQSFLSCAGVDMAGTPRDQALCNYTIMQDMPLVVPDTSVDPRFAQNPFVASGPKVRFYAGAPITMRPGINLGSLCILDMETRAFSEVDAAHLAALADVIINEIHGRRAGIDLRRREALLAQTARMARVGGWELDCISGRWLWSNEARRLCNMPADAESSLENALAAMVDPDARQAALAAFGRLLTEGAPFDIELQIADRHGQRRWLRARAEGSSVDGRIVHISGALHDITARREAQAQIEHLAFSDALTGLPNRLKFQIELEAAIRTAKGKGRRAGLLEINLDYFKDVNDIFGSQTGDAILSAVAERLKQIFGDNAKIARIGGDEFAVIVPEPADAQALVDLASQLQDGLKTTFEHAGMSIRISATIGISYMPSHDISAARLMANAKFALVRAKKEARGGCVLFRRWMREETESHAALLREIRTGVERAEFFMQYQPIVSLREEKVSGFEALMRWKHPQRGVLAPAAFAAGLEDPDLSIALGEIALDTSIQQIRAWLREGIAFGRVAVNLSGAQFRLPDLAPRILEKLARWNVPARHLMLEVTEGVYLDWAADLVVSTVKTLHEAGVLIALDDFGTGYASLAHLRQFHIDRIKIDKTFIQKPENAAIVDAVINMGSSLGLPIVAEGVETKEQLALLRMKGCEFIQGYFFSKPMDAEKVQGFVAGFDLAAFGVGEKPVPRLTA